MSLMQVHADKPDANKATDGPGSTRQPFGTANAPA
jgi:hypothetical protein